MNRKAGTQATQRGLSCLTKPAWVALFFVGVTMHTVNGNLRQKSYFVGFTMYSCDSVAYLDCAGSAYPSLPQASVPSSLPQQQCQESKAAAMVRLPVAVSPSGVKAQQSCLIPSILMSRYTDDII